MVDWIVSNTIFAIFIIETVSIPPDWRSILTLFDSAIVYVDVDSGLYKTWFKVFPQITNNNTV